MDEESSESKRNPAVEMAVLIVIALFVSGGSGGLSGTSWYDAEAAEDGDLVIMSFNSDYSFSLSLTLQMSGDPCHHSGGEYQEGTGTCTIEEDGLQWEVIDSNQFYINQLDCDESGQPCEIESQSLVVYEIIGDHMIISSGEGEASECVILVRQRSGGPSTLMEIVYDSMNIAHFPEWCHSG